MSAFSPNQVRALTGKLDRRHVRTRQVDGRDISYIEGWFAVGEANAIFGYGGWDRETYHFERVFERTRGDATQCAYLARVRIRVRAGKQIISREGTGWGSASSRNPAEAHELAAKAAETDATKRALATFGNRFGLGLYDKDQAGVTPRPTRPTFVIHDGDGVLFASDLSAEGLCTGLKQLIEKSEKKDLLSIWRHNVLEVERLKRVVPTLKNRSGDHYADLLERLLHAKCAAKKDVESPTARGARAVVADDARSSDVSSAEPPTTGAPANGSDGVTSASAASAPAVVNGADPIPPLAPSRIAYGPRIDKAALVIATARRMRDKSHLRHVGTLPCLICKSIPSHPHHLTFAQPRGLALKVSDEFVVPLCAIHHNELHLAGAEELWWKRVGIDPLPIARQLWEQREV